MDRHVVCHIELQLDILDRGSRGSLREDGVWLKRKICRLHLRTRHHIRENVARFWKSLREHPQMICTGGRTLDDEVGPSVDASYHINIDLECYPGYRSNYSVTEIGQG
jgi:hypothetical protein